MLAKYILPLLLGVLRCGIAEDAVHLKQCGKASCTACDPDHHGELSARQQGEVATLNMSSLALKGYHGALKQGWSKGTTRD